MLTALPQALDPARFGGKAAALARLAAAGIRIPAGVVLPVGTTVTDELVAEVFAWAKTRTAYGVIARSSAPVEDGVHASYAGVFASCFAPRRGEHVAAAIRMVLASAESDTVAAYQRARGLGSWAMAGMAVLVQVALRPLAAGVACISADGDTRIEATWGLSLLLLAGQTPPDVLTVDPDGTVTVQRVAEKVLTPLPATLAEADIPPGDWLTVCGLGWRAKLAHADPDEGLLYLSTPDTHARACCLPRESAAVIAATARRVAALLGYPGVDLEWVLDSSGRVHVVQARPLTTALPAPAAGRAPDSPAAGRVWRGVSASAGRVSGLTRVHRGPARPGEFPDGHILVTSSAGPELMPALITCSGVIATDAGALCHTAIVARELGTPCVVGLHDAPADFPTATLVDLDGTAGTVTILDPDAPAGPPTPATSAIPDTAWRIVASPQDLTSDAGSSRRGAVLVPDAVLLDQLAADPGLVDQWRTAGIVALLLPAGHRAPTGSTVALPGAGDLHWITEPPTGQPAILVVIAPCGEALFRTRLPGAATEPPEVPT